MANTQYIFSAKQNLDERDRLRVIESIFDDRTKQNLHMAGIDTGMKCLEIGAGAGSIAAWMSKVVGPSGRVDAVDVNTKFLQEINGDNIQVHEADIRGVKLEPSDYDIVHARMVFIHQEDFNATFEATLKFVKAGGKIVLEDPDFSIGKLLSKNNQLCTNFDKVRKATEIMFSSRKMDYAFGFRLPQVLNDYGLEIISVDNYAPMVRGDSALAELMRLSTMQLRDIYISTGCVTADEIDFFIKNSIDRTCWVIYFGDIAVVAQKP